MVNRQLLLDYVDEDLIQAQTSTLAHFLSGFVVIVPCKSHHLLFHHHSIIGHGEFIVCRANELVLDATLHLVVPSASCKKPSRLIVVDITFQFVQIDNQLDNTGLICRL